MTAPTRRRSARAALALGALAVVGLAGCSSTPSAKRVALDVIGTLDVSDDAKACMEDKVEGYDEDELERIAELADSGDPTGREEITAFSDDLAECVAGTS